MFENFTPAAIRAIADALHSAKILGRKEAGAEHLLFGLSAHECLAQSLLAQEGINAESLEKQLIMMDGKLPPSTKVDIPFDISAKNVLERAQDVRKDSGHDQLNSGHLLLGIVSDSQSKASQILTLLGGSNQLLSTSIPIAIANAVQSKDFETVPEQKVSREDQLAKFVEWATTTPNWKTELKLAMEAAGVSIAEVEQGLHRKR